MAVHFQKIPKSLNGFLVALRIQMMERYHISGSRSSDRMALSWNLFANWDQSCVIHRIHRGHSSDRMAFEDCLPWNSFSELCDNIDMKRLCEFFLQSINFLDTIHSSFMMSKIQLTTKHNLKAEKQLKNNIFPSSEGGDQLLILAFWVEMFPFQKRWYTSSSLIERSENRPMKMILRWRNTKAPPFSSNQLLTKVMVRARCGSSDPPRKRIDHCKMNGVCFR